MYFGPWIHLTMDGPPFAERKEEREIVVRNPRTLIHKDETARKLGFKGALIGGLMLEAMVFPAIDATLGHLWYEGGAYSVRHKVPVYAGKSRAVWEEGAPAHGDIRMIRFWIESKGGEKTVPGWASLGKRGEKPVPPWERQPLPPVPSPEEDLIPEIKVGGPLRSYQVSYDVEEITERFDRSNSSSGYNWWHRIASPWGRPIASGLEIAAIGYKDTEFVRATFKPPGTSRFRTPIDAGHDIVIYRPMFVGQVYNVNHRICHKWQTESTLFFVDEYKVDDLDRNNIAVMRAYTAHLIKDLQPADKSIKKA
ncbi:MAG: hypothetical protein JW856_00685 [Dehalococcoidales bacterium]|nr:hypothetical protein [Dehalococcoidales bacterium]